MNRSLDDLDPRFREVAMALIARCTEAEIPVRIIDTRRTAEEHADNLRRGASWTAHSKHLDGLAIDICPYESYVLHGANKLDWNADDPVWQEIGQIGEELGLVWGGRWKQKDLGHFEMAAEAKA